MADFFSQFQVHPPNDFNLGGFQQEGPKFPGMAPQTPMMDTGTGMGFDPRLLPQQPGSDFGMPPAIAKDPNKPGAFIDPGTGQPYQGGTSNQTGQVNFGNIGALAGGIGNLMRGHGMTPPQQAMLGSAISQPMNPAQQSGALGSSMVQMMGPDGSQQFVDPAHVPHYTSLGATLMNPQAMQQIGQGAQVTGQQLAGMSGSSYGGGNG